MDVKQISAGTIAGAITTFLLGFIMYEVMGGAAQFFNGPGAAEGIREAILLGPIFLIDVAAALLITIVYSRWANIKTFASGAKNGLWIGLLLGLMVQLDFYACTEVSSVTGVLFYAATHAIRMALAGGVIGWILGKLSTN